MADDAQKVAIVVSVEAAPSMVRLARDCPVWAIRTAETESIARHARHVGGDVTLFIADDDPEAALLSIIGEVELHHGAHSRDPAVGVIEVLGAPLTDTVREQFRSLDFRRLEVSPDGFVAYRR